MDTLRVKGLYRHNAEGQEVVYRLLQRLSESELLDMADLEERKSEIVNFVETEVAGEPRWAFPFEFKLPLKRRIRLHDEEGTG